jgi:hypothetical protein
MELVERREEVHWLWKHFLVSQRRICELINVAESSQRYVSRKKDEVLRTKLVEAARRMERGVQRRAAAQQFGIFGAARICATNCRSPVAYGSLRAATRRMGKDKSHEFRRSWCRMIPCAELGGRSVAFFFESSQQANYLYSLF